MKLTLADTQIHISTGGRKFRDAAPYVLFLHGSGQNHLGWGLQSRYFAYQGYNVVVPDFPGHGLSSGEPLTSIEDMARWVIEVMDSLGIEKAVIIGHSQGCLVSLELAAHYRQRVVKLALIAGALSIGVNDYLVSSSDSNQRAAIAMMTSWGHGRLAHFHDNTQPGFSHFGFGRALMTANHNRALHSDLLACRNYQSGGLAADLIRQPCLVIRAGADKMIPAGKGRELAGAIKNSQLVVIPGGAHMLPSEYPDDVNAALLPFLTP